MPHQFTTEFSRRDYLKISLASALGVSFSGWLPVLARQALGQSPDSSQRSKPKRSCILLWMNGGPSQLDTFDPKPGASTGGPFQAISTAAPGVRISEHLPGLAKHTQRMAIIRSMASKEGDHGRATYLTRTGYRPLGPISYPSLGCLVSKQLGLPEARLPNFVSISPFRAFNQSAYGPGFLGPAYAPLTVAAQAGFQATGGDELKVDDLKPPAHLGADRAQKRADLLQFVQKEFRKRRPDESAQTHGANYQRALRMLTSETEAVFDLKNEPAALRDRYGRNRFGQGCLLARRLVEHGVPFVEVGMAGVPGAGIGWDTHLNNFDSVRRLSQVLDPGWSTLMEDLKSRGLMESTLIVWMGEFGRTPRINGFTGRDHWPRCWSAVLAGGAVQGGQIIGDTGKEGLGIEDRPITVPELIATICQALGINPSGENISEVGRPISFVDNQATAVAELLA